jgi:hypothetical protein
MSFLTICISIFVIGSIYFFLKDYINVFSKTSELEKEVKPTTTPEPVRKPKTEKKKEKSPVKFLKEVETVSKKGKKSTTSKTTAEPNKKAKLKTPKTIEAISIPSKRGRKKK